MTIIKPKGFGRNINDLIAAAEKRIEKACDVLEASPHGGIFVGHSGGKDSAVVFSLASNYFRKRYAHLKDIVDMDKLATCVHTIKPSGVNRTHPDTIRYLYDYVGPRCAALLMTTPEMMRKLCEYSDLTVQIDGTRASEFERHDRSSTLIMDGKEQSREHMGDSTTNGVFGLDFCYPIYDWTDDEVWTYLYCLNIPVSDEYL